MAIEFGLGRSEYVVERICRIAVTAVTTITDTMATWATMEMGKGKGTILGPVVSVSVSVVVVGPVVAIRFIRPVVSDSDDSDDRANKRKSSSAGTVITDVVVTATAAAGAQGL